jgi:4-hydroxybenzoate polyprenyltransferase
MACYVGMLGLLAVVGSRLALAWPFYAGLTVAAGMMGYHWRLIRDRSREGSFRAFRHNNWVGGAIFVGIIFAQEGVWPWR